MEKITQIAPKNEMTLFCTTTYFARVELRERVKPEPFNIGVRMGLAGSALGSVMAPAFAPEKESADLSKYVELHGKMMEELKMFGWVTDDRGQGYDLPTGSYQGESMKSLEELHADITAICQRIWGPEHIVYVAKVQDRALSGELKRTW
jgi:hypothetical protein